MPGWRSLGWVLLLLAAVAGIFANTMTGNGAPNHGLSTSAAGPANPRSATETAAEAASAAFTSNLTGATQVALTVPVSLTSLVPTSATAGGPGFVLTGNGLSFFAGVQLRWNGSDRPTNFVSSTQLTAAISAGDIAAPGTAYVQLFIPGTGGGSANALPFTINAAVRHLDVLPATLTFQAPASGSNPPTQVLRIGSSAVSAAWTAQASTANGGPWLSVSAGSGTASPGASFNVVVTAKTAGLAAGVYSGSVLVQESAATGPLTAPVIFSVLAAAPLISLTQTGLQFTAVEGSSAVPSQSFGILNSGQGPLNWNLGASPFTGGAWLSVSPATGSSQPAPAAFPSATVTVNPTLLAGDYYGQIDVSAAGASNSPQSVSVQLRVLPRANNPGAMVSPTGLIFVGPGSAQTVRLATSAPAGLSATVTVATTAGGTWLDAQPRALSLAAGASQTISVSAAPGTLGAGVYQGTVTLTFSDGSTQTVNVLFLIPESTAPARRGFAAACAPKKLIAVMRTLGSNFSPPAGWPSPVEAQVIEDCGSPITNATVVASFSSGDPPLPLVSLGNGIYSGTWRPVNFASQVTVTLRANLVPLAEATLVTQGKVLSNPTAPFISSGGIVNAASFASGQPLAPGSIVSLFGGKMAAATPQGAASLPLPSTLGGARLTIGGQKVPLYYTRDDQINAQVPFELAPNTRPQALVRVSLPGVEAVSVPEIITLDVARPGVFTIPGAVAQGVVINLQGQVVNDAAPATAGDFVVVYAAGLGPTNPAVASGQASPSDPPARVTSAATVTVGGVTADVPFAGLTPGLVGLYQLNVRIPSGVTPGPAVPLVVTQNGVSSNTVTLAIQ